MDNWRLAQNLEASGRRGVIVGVCIAVLIIFAVIALVVVKLCLLKKLCGCDCCLDEFEDDYYLDSDDPDENGCAYTSEKDFVQ
ncbi:MAG: hypothetical protein FWB96_00805 [Defluviitaleaceae bacterium]|nr:hypothetical protein [Defluviitaleaceae bacterium]MCL2262748.1 hypothetical protein [Defluviitaleaceae bacterium]